MTRGIVSVATTPQYRKGMERLSATVGKFNQNRNGLGKFFHSHLPNGWPAHEDIPYGFKAFALKQAADSGSDLLLWCDASVVPIAEMEPLWQRIERDGYWMSKNGWMNSEWTADAAYPDLFPEYATNSAPGTHGYDLIAARSTNRSIQHVVATTFGLNVAHPKGRLFLSEYFRLASETKAFCGPWTNANAAGLTMTQYDGVRVAPCGPADVLGHRHDQSAASVIAWRLGFELTEPPVIFSYGKEGESHDQRTILLADGSCFI